MIPSIVFRFNIPRQKWFTLLFIILTLQAFGQDECVPVGWATYGGTLTGGGSATPVLVTTIAQLKTEANSAGAKVIYVQGTLGAGYLNGAGERVDVSSNKTIYGLPGATIRAFVSIKNATNVIIRNLIFQGPGAHDVDGWDNMTIETSTRVWIDHCDFRDGEDGNMDIKRQSNNVAVTWCKFSYSSISTGHMLSTLVGHDDAFTADAGYLKVTFQYNWFAQGCVERQPRVRFGQVHVVNNLYTSTTADVGVTGGASGDVRVESNAFYGTNDPIDLSKANGSTKVSVINNLFSGTSGSTAGVGTAFTPPYTLATIPAAQVQAKVTPCVGATLPNPQVSLACPCGSSLPIDLISFNIKPHENSYLLDWLLADNETLKDIVIEYSGDGIYFHPLEMLDKDANYYVLSASDLPDNSILYVRLKFIEEDGYVTFSPVRAIGKNNSVHLFPNPFVNEINVGGINEGTIMIYTMNGNKVYENTISEPGPINLRQLSSGTYFLILIDNSRNEIKRVPLIKL